MASFAMDSFWRLAPRCAGLAAFARTIGRWRLDQRRVRAFPDAKRTAVLASTSQASDGAHRAAKGSTSS